MVLVIRSFNPGVTFKAFIVTSDYCFGHLKFKEHGTWTGTETVLQTPLKFNICFTSFLVRFEHRIFMIRAKVYF